MTVSPLAPIPKDLRQQMMREVEQAPDEDLVLVHEALLHARKLRLLDEISAGAEREEAAGKWDRLPEMIAAVRAKLRSA